MRGERVDYSVIVVGFIGIGVAVLVAVLAVFDVADVIYVVFADNVI